MINSLDFSVTFKKPSKTFTGKHTFKNGLTLIVGKNESGKSLLLEMGRFALWGTSALRCPAGDYAKIKTDMDFTVKGTKYTVKRTKGTAHLYEGKTEIATGTSPVNARIEELFGYGQEVFNLSNVALQSDIERLGDMKPAARKRLVDQVIGLTSIDEAIKTFQGQATEIRAEIKGAEEFLVEPEEPSTPLIEFDDDILDDLQFEYRMALARDAAQAAFDAVKEPKKPEGIPENVVELYDIYKRAAHMIECPSCKHKFLRSGETIDTSMVPDNIAELHERWQSYQTQMNMYLNRKLKLKEYSSYDTTENVERKLNDAKRKKVDADRSTYEWVIYGDALDKYNANKDKLQLKKDDLNDLTNTINGLKELKVKIKTHLVPSLNTAASIYLNQMTDGLRNSIVVTEDFDVTVDGQKLEALSGSAKAVANLALRIGLGQVLTNEVFSVFMGDEIDGSMDDQRAKATAICLRNLTKSIDQVIIVSHKKNIEADHYLEL